MALLLIDDPARTFLVPIAADETLVVGRSAQCDIVVTVDRASRRHAEIRPDGEGGHCVVDLGSTNGTRVDGLEVETLPLPLPPGAQIAIGACRIAYRPDPDAAPAD